MLNHNEIIYCCQYFCWFILHDLFCLHCESQFHYLLLQLFCFQHYPSKFFQYLLCLDRFEIIIKCSKWMYGMFKNENIYWRRTEISSFDDQMIISLCYTYIQRMCQTINQLVHVELHSCNQSVCDASCGSNRHFQATENKMRKLMYYFRINVSNSEVHCVFQI